MPSPQPKKHASRLQAIAAGAFIVCTLVACAANDTATRPQASPVRGCYGPPVTSGPGGRLFAIADADMVATAYTNNQLGPIQAGVLDSLSLIDPGAAIPNIVASGVVPNAVTSAPWIFETNAEGSRAYVIESSVQRSANLATLTELRSTPSNRLTVVDICGKYIKPLESVSTANLPSTASLRSTDRHLVVSGRNPARLVIHSISKDGTVGSAVNVSLPAGVAPAESAPSVEQEITYAGWSPNGELLAVAVRSTRKLLILRATDAPNGLNFAAVGNPVDIDEGTFGGAWSPDSRFFYLNNVRLLSRPMASIMSNSDIVGLPTAQLFAQLAGSVQVVAMSGAVSSSPQVLQTLATPLFPEGIRLSPDGRLLATLNMQTTALPNNSPLFSPNSSISLWTRDLQTGLLTKLNDTSFEGILPEGLAFDPTSKYLATAVYHPTNADRTSGAVDIWEVVGTASAATLKLRHRVNTPRGVHQVQWLK
jgi:hypothetical protein